MPASQRDRPLIPRKEPIHTPMTDQEFNEHLPHICIRWHIVSISIAPWFEEKENVITEVEWIAQATYGEYVASSDGITTLEIDLPDDVDFGHWNDLTQDEVVGWVYNGFDKLTEEEGKSTANNLKDEIEDNLRRQIREQMEFSDQTGQRIRSFRMIPPWAKKEGITATNPEAIDN